MRSFLTCGDLCGDPWPLRKITKEISLQGSEREEQVTMKSTLNMFQTELCVSLVVVFAFRTLSSVGEGKMKMTWNEECRVKEGGGETWKTRPSAGKRRNRKKNSKWKMKECYLCVKRKLLSQRLYYTSPCDEYLIRFFFQYTFWNPISPHKDGTLFSQGDNRLK